MINKELLSEVLALTVVKVLELEGSILWYKGIVNVNGSPYAKELSVNIYELAHKCKEWAFNNGYELRSGQDIDVKKELCYFCEYKQERQLDYLNGDYFLAETEPEAIFKACQWILTKELA